MDVKQFTNKKRALFDKLYARLNDKQREAVYTVNGPLLVLAGAGSGKTTVLVNRISHLISFGDLYAEEAVPDGAEKLLPQMDALLENGSADKIRHFLQTLVTDCAAPWQILCITFTNKAANEFKTRLQNILGDASSELWAGTFHSICARILRMHIDALGYSKSFTIYDTDDSKRVIVEAMKRLGISEDTMAPKTLLNEISRAKEKCMDWREFQEYADGDARLETVAAVYNRYSAALREANALDFDDIILLTIKLFAECPDILEKYQKRFKYVLVDEYQDTNVSQSRLVELFAGQRKNVCVVGDDDQSIYAFRGATVDNILNFDKHYEGCKTVRLEQNYRSTKTILAAANALIANNSARKGKELWTDGEEGERILLKKQFTQSEEAGYIVNYIRDRVSEGQARYKDFAVLYRLNAQANALEIIFSKSRIPYRIFGGTRFYERKEIKDLISYLAVISNPSDEVRLRRIINVPKRGIGAVTLQTLFEQADRGDGAYEVLRNIDNNPELIKSAPRLKGFFELMEGLRAYAADHKVSELVSELIERTGYKYMLQESDEPEKAELLDELVSSAVAFEESEESEDKSLEAFLSEVALIADVDNYDDDANAVTLMTVHSAKGLEFPTVFLPGFEEGVFPGDQSTVSDKALEEERRLAYVAITRAQKQLVITHTNTRLLYGQTKQNPLSRFAMEIPKSIVRIEQPVKTVYNNVSEAKRRYAASQEAFLKNTGRVDTSVKIKTGNELMSAGERVSHVTFGTGTVLSVKEMGGDALYEIDFDTVGKKKLMASFAKLKKA